MLWSPDWWAAIWNSARYSFLVISLTFLPPVILAILLQEIPRGKIFFRLCTIPAVISGWSSSALEIVLRPLGPWRVERHSDAIPVVGFVAAGGLAFAVAVAFARRLFLHNHRIAAILFFLAGVALLSLSMSWVRPVLSIETCPLGSGC